MLWWVVALSAVLGLIPAAIASSKGRSFGGWWLFGVVMFLPALIIALVISSESGYEEARRLASGEARCCPACAEVVRLEALVCRWCGRELPPHSGTPAPAGMPLVLGEDGRPSEVWRLLAALVGHGPLGLHRAAELARLDGQQRLDALHDLIATGWAEVTPDDVVMVTPAGSAAHEAQTAAAQHSAESASGTDPIARGGPAAPRIERLGRLFRRYQSTDEDDEDLARALAVQVCELMGWPTTPLQLDVIEDAAAETADGLLENPLDLADVVEQVSASVVAAMTPTAINELVRTMQLNAVPGSERNAVARLIQDVVAILLEGHQTAASNTGATGSRRRGPDADLV